MTSVPEGAQQLLLELARHGGDIAREYFRSTLTVANKEDGAGFDPVTDADRRIERELRDRISSRFPDHRILGEEFEDRGGDSPFAWHIDPIDGTRAFMTGSPLWGCLIGLSVDGRPALGALCQPILGELFWGTPDASYLDNDSGRIPLHAAATTRLEQATLYATHPEMFSAPGEQRAFETLSEAVRMTRFGGDCYNYGLLAAGFTDLVVESGLKAFDILPLLPILQGAGCVVSDWGGNAVTGGGAVLAAATPELHAAALSLLQP